MCANCTAILPVCWQHCALRTQRTFSAFHCAKAGALLLNINMCFSLCFGAVGYILLLNLSYLPPYSRPWGIGRGTRLLQTIMIVCGRVPWQCCSFHARISVILHSSAHPTSVLNKPKYGPCSGSPDHHSFTWSHISGRVRALTGYTWPRDLSRYLISMGPGTCV